MRNDRQAYLTLAAESVSAKVKKIEGSSLPFKMKLAAILASDTNKGKTWN